jgi:hypothetical protein
LAIWPLTTRRATPLRGHQSPLPTQIGNRDDQPFMQCSA